MKTERRPKAGRRTAIGDFVAQQKANTLLVDILESVSDGFFAVDNDLVATYFNSAAERLLGRERRDVLGRNLFEAFPEAKGSIFEGKYTQALREKKRTDFEIHFDVEPYANWYDVSVYPQASGLSVFFRVITERKKTEAALRESEGRFRRLFEESNDAVFIHDFQGSIVDVNSKACEMIGCDRDTLLGMTVPELHPTEELPKVIEALETTAEAGSVRFESSFERSDGTVIDVDISSSTVDSDKGIVQDIVRDMTERRLAEDALEKADERLRCIFESASDGIAVTDLQGNMTDVNGSAIALYGAKAKDELLGKNALEFIAPRDRQRAVRNMERALTRGTSGTQEYAVLRLDGSEFPAELTASVVDRTPDRPDGFVAVVRDITERKEAEEALRESEERYHAIFSEAGDGVVLIDAETGLIRDCNPEFERQTGRDSDQLKKMRIWEIRPHEKMEATRVKFAKIRAQGKGESAELEFCRPDGQIVPIEFRSTVITIRGREYVQSIARDVTERRQAEEALRESENRYRQVVSTTADSIVIIDSETRRLLDVNHSWEELYGYAADEARDLIMADISAAPDKTEESVAEAMAGELRRIPERYHRKKDGTVFPVEVSLGSFEMGGRQVLCSVIRDITERREMETELQRSEEYFRAMIENALDGITVLNRDGTIRYQSPSQKRMFGLQSGSLVGAMAFDGVHPDDLPKVIWQFEQIVDGAISQTTMQIRYRHMDGSWRTLEATGNNLLDNPSVNGIVVNFRDVTERVQAEEILRTSEGKLRTLFETIPDSIAITDMSGNITEANWALVRLHGFDLKSELIGRATIDLVAERDRPRAVEHIGKALESGNAPLTTYALIVKDGREVEVEAGASLLRDGLGHPSGLVAVIRDITERKRAQEVLRESEQRYRLLAENVQDVITSTDMNLVPTYTSPSLTRLLGFTVEEAMARRIDESLTPASREVALKALAHQMEREKEELAESHLPGTDLEFYRKDGSTVWVEVRVSVLRDSDGNPIGLVNLLRDVSERKKAEDERNRMEQQLQLAGRLAAVGELAAGVAHEVNNPLAAAQAYAQLLMERSDLDESLRHDIDVIYHQVQRATRITGNLLSFARRHAPDKQPTAINEVIERSAELYAYRMRTNGIELVMETAPDLPRTKADFYQLQAVFVNLIANAEQAMMGNSNGGRLVIRSLEARNMIQVTFADNGPGILKEHLASIFDPFFTTKEVGEGTGLGLSICHGIVQGHGGRISVRSKVGQGSTFTVELPIVPEDEAHHPPSGAAKKGAQ